MRDERLNRFWQQPDGLPSLADDEARMKAYLEWAEESGSFSKSILEAIKKLAEGKP